MTETRHPADELRDMYARQEMDQIREWECPRCGAISGEKCIRPDGKYQMAWTHVERTLKAFPRKSA